MKPLTEEQIADNGAAVAEYCRGGQVQSKHRDNLTFDWATEATPTFDFTRWIFRPAPWQLPSHIPGFRALLDSEEWHRQDWTREMLPDGWRPLLEAEHPVNGDQRLNEVWETWPCGDPSSLRGGVDQIHLPFRTRRPLPAVAPSMRAWSKPEDVPGPICWIRGIQAMGYSTFSMLVIYIHETGVVCGHRNTNVEFQWEELEGRTYSTTRTAGLWHKCEVTA